MTRAVHLQNIRRIVTSVVASVVILTALQLPCTPAAADSGVDRTGQPLQLPAASTTTRLPPAAHLPCSSAWTATDPSASGLSASQGLAKAAPCNAAAVQQMLNTYASVAVSFVNPADRAIVLNAVAPYAEGSAPPLVTLGSNGQYQVQIPSKAAAFYLAGIDAVFQNNKLVAGWAFLEAARRNPSEAMFLNNAAFILLQYDLFYGARDLLRCALATEPEFNSARINLGHALGSLGDHAGAASAYLGAALDQPANDDYQYLAATELARAGSSEWARIIAEIGQGLTSDHDFDALLASLPPPSEPGTCQMPTMPPPSNTAFNFVTVDIPMAHVSNVSSPVNAYDANTLFPAVVQAAADKSSCESAESQAWTTCGNACWGDQLCLARCDCQYGPRMARCAVTKEQTEYAAWVGYFAYWNGLLNAWFPTSQSMLAGVQSSLTTQDSQWAACEVGRWNQTYAEGFRLDAADTLPWEQRDIANERRNVATMVDFYCNRSIETWIYTGGPGFGFEPQWCLAFICFSYDAVNQTVAVSAALLLAGKLSVNLVNGDWAVNLGVGGQFGVGQLALGGGVYFKVSEGKVGIEPKAFLGPLEANYFVGFERLNVPVGPQPYP